MSDFVDTNILVYALQEKEAQHATALRLLQSGPFTSVQALNEFVWTSRRKFKLSADELQSGSTALRGLLAAFTRCCWTIMLRHLQISARYKLQWWDSLLLSVALRVGTTRFFSEDGQHDQVIGGRLRIVNPFI